MFRRFRPGARRARRARSARPQYLFRRKPLVELLEDRRMLAVVTVSNNNDDDNGDTSSIAALIADDGGDGISLREAIIAANNTANVVIPDEIRFNIGGGGLRTIQPDAELPTISDPVIIDGYTQSGASVNTLGPGEGLNTVLTIQLDGLNAAGANGLQIDGGGDGSTIRGLAVFRFDNVGIGINAANGNTISGNFVGTNAAGAAFGNSFGIVASFAQGNTIGGTSAADSNLVSGNTFHGVLIIGKDASGNMVQRNYIGTETDGESDLGNGSDGVAIEDNAPDNLIGGTAANAGNTIAFNDNGVTVVTNGATGNRISHNSIFNNDNLGIDLEADGVTNNDGGDGDPGPNLLQNFPEFIGNATLLGDSIAFRYRVNSAVGANATYPLDVEFFVADSNNQEGQTFLATDTYIADDAQQFIQVVVPAPAVLTNIFIVATATDAEGNTSEFSDDVRIAPPIFLGSEPTILRQEEFINIDQVNFYQYIAHSTGKLIVRIDFLHLFGDLALEVRDEFGNLLGRSDTSSADQNWEEVIIPVVQQERYFINVIAVDFTDDFGQVYGLELENIPAPAPTGVHLDPASDTGMMNNDNVTADTTPTFYIQTDVLNFVDTNNSGFYEEPDNGGSTVDALEVLNAADVEEILTGVSDDADDPDDIDNGIAVEVTLVNTTTGTFLTGFADPVIPTLPDVYRFTVPDDMELTPGVWLISARTKVWDAQGDEEGEPDQAMGRSSASPPLWITIQTDAPENGTFDLLESSDTGMEDDDYVTKKWEPAFGGIGLENAKVHVYADETEDDPTNPNFGQPEGNPFLVGSGVVGTDLTDGVAGDGFGIWEVTVEPMNEGKWNFFARFEDASGALGDPVAVTALETNDTAQDIPDNGTIESTIEIAVEDFPLVGDVPMTDVYLVDVNVIVNIEHPFVADLDIVLISPEGTEIELSTDNGNGGDNYTDTVFDDSAGTSITAGVAPFTGRFRPEEPLAPLLDESPIGTWTLRVTDDSFNELDGQLINWSLELVTPLMVVIDKTEPNTPYLDLLSGPTVRSTLFVNDDTLGTITDVNVTMSIDHPHAADLDVYLVSPTGTRVLLTSDNGGNGANYTNTVFNDAAATSIVNGTAPFTGTFRPEGSLADFNGEDPFGLWTLEVTDDTQPIMGQIISWTLDIQATADNFSRTSNDMLDISSDTGRDRFDNITKDNTPTVTMTSTDPNIEFAQFLFLDNLKFRIFDRYEDNAEFLLYDSALDADVDEYLSAGDMFTALTLITEILPEQYFDLFGGAANPAVLAGGVLADGVHNLKLEVEDRAGNISHDFLLSITIDTAFPPVSFGLPDEASEIDGLKAESDTGVTTVPATFADRITSDTTPTLWGRAEADTIVRVYLDRDYDGIIDLNTDTFLGQTVALPYDGNDAYPDGYWELTSALDLNELFVNAGLEKDGLRRLLVTAEDVAGNPMPMNNEIDDGVDELHIFIDTQGPQVTDVTINDLTSRDYDLFDPKPSENGPTPLIDSLTIHFQDLPSRVQAALAMNSFLYEALVNNNGIAAAPGNYLLVGDHNGIIPIRLITVNNESAADYTFNGTLTQVTSTTVIRDSNLPFSAEQPVVGDYILINNGAAAGQVRRIVAYNSGNGQMTLDVPLLNLPAAGNSYMITTFAEATVELDFFAPLPDDRYTLTVSDNLVDPANNKLDGESNADEPQDNPEFPSGDGVPGGDFVARFTVDSRPELGSYVAVDIDIDINGNFIWDPAPVPVGGDATNVDLSFTLPVQNANGSIGVGGYNVHDLLFAGKFLPLNNENGSSPNGGAGGGSGNGNGFEEHRFFDQLAAFGNSAEGIPGSMTPQFRWIIDTDSNGVVTQFTDIITHQDQFVNGFNVAGAIPIAGDFNRNPYDGDEIGLYNAGRWALDTNKNYFIDAADTFLNGDLLGAPIVGDFDGNGEDDLAVFNNNQFFFDLTFDGFYDDMFIWGFPGVLDKPVAADMDQDGIDDIGLWVPRTSASLPQGVAEWYFLLSNDRNGANRITGQANTLDHAFTPTPFGFDIFAEFGDERSLPIVGNFDPPVAAAPNQTTTLPGDYDGNGTVEWADYQVWVNNFGTTNLVADGNGDGRVDAADYSVWRDHRGQTAEAGSGSGALAASTTATDSSAELVSTQVVTSSVSAPIEPVALQVEEAATPVASTAAASVEPSLAAMLPVTSSQSTTLGDTSAGVVSTTLDVRAGDPSLLLLVAEAESAGIDEALGEYDALEVDDALAAAAGQTTGLDGALAIAWGDWDEL